MVKPNNNKNFYVIQRFSGNVFKYKLYSTPFIFVRKFCCILLLTLRIIHTKYNEPDKINSSLNMWDYYFEPINQYKLDEYIKRNLSVLLLIKQI